MRESIHVRLAVPALVLANVALALGTWAVRLARSEALVGPVAAGFWRLGLAAPVLLLAAWRLERLPPRPRGALVLVALGGLSFAADLAFWHVGILATRLANATLLGNATALLLPLYTFLVARAWPRPRQALALSLAGVGAALLLGRSFQLSADHLWGDFACIAAGIFYTAYLVIISDARGRLGPVTVLAVVSAAGAPPLLLAALALGEGVWPAAWWPLLLLTAGSQLLGQGLILYAVARASPLLVGIMLLIQPIVGAAFGWLIYGEALSGLDYLGGIAVGAAVLLVREPRRPPAPLPADAAGLSSPA